MVTELLEQQYARTNHAFANEWDPRIPEILAETKTGEDYFREVWLLTQLRSILSHGIPHHMRICPQSTVRAGRIL